MQKTPHLAYKAAVPIDDIDELWLSPKKGFSIVWLDTVERPDLAVLSGQKPLGGHCILSWFYRDPGEKSLEICLYIKMRQPVQFALSLIFPVKMYAHQLETISKNGALWLVEGPPPKHLVGRQAMDMQAFMQQVVKHTGQGLFIEMEEHLVEELREQLVHWKRL